MKKYNLTINDRTYDVEVLDINLEEASLRCNGKKYTVAINKIERLESATPKKKVDRKPMTQRVAKASTPPATGSVASDGAVVAPIPGAILDIFVAEGDTVTAGQALLKMEAMKMENEISAPTAGTITKISVAKGDAVAQGQAMIVIE